MESYFHIIFFVHHIIVVQKIREALLRAMAYDHHHGSAGGITSVSILEYYGFFFIFKTLVQPIREGP